MGNGKNIWIVKRIEKALKGTEPVTTPAILQKLLQQKNHAGRPYERTVTMQQPVNLLSKNPQFIKHNDDGNNFQLSGVKYPVARWELRERKTDEEE